MQLSTLSNLPTSPSSPQTVQTVIEHLNFIAESLETQGGHHLAARFRHQAGKLQQHDHRDYATWPSRV